MEPLPAANKGHSYYQLTQKKLTSNFQKALNLLQPTTVQHTARNLPEIILLTPGILIPNFRDAVQASFHHIIPLARQRKGISM